MILEVIAFNIQSCITIEASGAHRIELCDNPGEGGTTPSYGFIKAAREKTTIDLYPIIRPRGGDFLYSEDEFEMMKADISICKELGCDGVVIGMLNPDGSIDKIRSSKLVQLAYPMGVTFHRAFDRANDLQKALEDVIEIGCERILSSGGFPDVLQGMETLEELVTLAANRIIMMPGSGVRSTNIAQLAAKTGAIEFHTSARKTITGNMVFNSPAMNENLQTITVDEEELAKTVQVLQGITLPG
ncbi:MAG: copper homeostasis protein CutC [Pedobacter sp.]|nr:MAG: copper homeostasis protein CutC [Pedobacter sp.]